MPLQKKFDTYPYFDDYNESKDYYKVLFKPGVAIQARELNQLQTILQKQIERFGDHLFKSGTVISGINFSYLPNFSYVKILDTDVDGRPVTPSVYRGLQVINSANLVGLVVESRDGFESKDPDLNTLYIRYLNSGNTGSVTTYNNNDTLTVFSPQYPITGITINNGGASFSNTDDVVITSAIRVRLSNTSTRFANAEVVYQGGSVQLEVIEAIDVGNNTSSSQILRVKPVNADLATLSYTSARWTPQISQSIGGLTSGAFGQVNLIYGAGARGIATTDALGAVRVITVAQGGRGYLYAPHVSIRPQVTPSADLANLDLEARNYKAKVTVAGASFANAVGSGYAFTVSEGVIYQKGYFSRVTPQLAIVSKYSNQPDNLVVGFTTDESNVGVTFDSSLYDNAANTTNYKAPGADRLRLTPSLKVVTSAAAEANTTFFPLVEFNDGQPSREYRDTQYNIIGREFERRTSETSGDFVIDPFFVTTKEIAGNTTHFSVIIDPGTAYISGKRVNTINNSYVAVPKVATTIARENTLLTASYGSYVLVNEVRGNFDVKTAATVQLYDVAAQAISNTAGTTAAPGASIGTARIRSFVHEDGIPGNPSTTYRLYLFDVQMNQGRYFENVRSIRFAGTNAGICDVVQTRETTSGALVTQLIDPTFTDSVFDVGITGVKTITNVSYKYRTSTEGLTIATDGTFSIAAPSGAQFPYAAGLTLNTDQKLDFNIFPLTTAVASANLAGSFGLTSTSANITSSASQAAALTSGDYIGLYSAPGSYTIRRVLSVNTSVIVLNANVGFTNATANAVLVFPANVPINFGRTGRSIATRPGVGGNATVDANLNIAIASSVQAVALYNIFIPNATRVSKTVNRNIYVKIDTSNNVAGATGPWSLGIPDIIRLKNVYEGTTTAGTNVTREFFIDDGGRGDAYTLATLVKRATSSYSTTAKQLLIELDCFTPSSGLEGFYTVDSYPINDSANLASSTSTINTLEIPELVSSRGRYYDLRECFDFRPVASNTAVLSTTAAGATINPAATFTLNADEKYFPVPGSDISYDSEVYQARADTVIVRSEGDFAVLRGEAREAASERTAPPAEAKSLLLNRLIIPRYPALPQVLSQQTLTFADKKVGNGRGPVSIRPRRFAVRSTLNNIAGPSAQPRGYNMKRIGTLERRIEALESFALMNIRENAIRNLSIPSSIDPTKQRFKNAFFVDGFDADTSADFNNTEFNASVEIQNSALLPKYYNRNLPLKFNRLDANTENGITQSTTALLLPYEEESVVSFTVGSIPYVPPAPSATPAVTPSPSTSRAPALSASASPTPLPSLTPAASPSPPPSVSPAAPPASASPSPSPSASPAATPPPSPSLSATASPSPTPSRSAASTPSPTPSISSSNAPSVSPTPTLSIAASIVTPIEGGGGGDILQQQNYEATVLWSVVLVPVTTTTTTTSTPDATGSIYNPLDVSAPADDGTTAGILEVINAPADDGTTAGILEIINSPVDTTPVKDTSPFPEDGTDLVTTSTPSVETTTSDPFGSDGNYGGDPYSSWDGGTAITDTRSDENGYGDFGSLTIIDLGSSFGFDDLANDGADYMGL